ncbi:elongator complex protein 2 isoform X2 [Bicyclus anynana]|uniref:Elongator complex protein 2 n=1 Tax=Bicyclus anynana TaxID=110368 RepID=A0ABM3LEC5_BICAN|nr:elongator complex protein 2 isoform X2 [Bicyclus anynana]
MKISVQQVYTSVACNRTPEIADWNNEGLICYGACNAVVIYDTLAKDKDPLAVLCHHKSTVNSVKWLQRPDSTCTELLSCSADKTAAIWSIDNGVWKISSSLEGHNEGVTCIHGVYVDTNRLLVYTGSIDSSICVWERIDGNTTLKQKINLNSGLALTLHSCVLPAANRPILFCALDDHKVHIFVEQSDHQYHRVHMLAGHEDWVRGLDVINVDNKTLMLASASQDTYIRLWKIQHYEEKPVVGIKVEEKVFDAYGVKLSVKLDAVLAGHEGWVYGVQWQKIIDNENSQPIYRLLSSSLDKTLIIWQPESHGDAWVESVRVGEVGGNGLGFYGSRFGPDAILGHGYNGSLHIWKYDKQVNQWQPGVVSGGHFSAVEDLRWEREGRYLLSVSLDQTTRLHAPWVRADGSGTQWHELARPQVHGYDLAAVALVSPAAFVSAAEEKVLRVFAAPHNFIHNFNNITGETLVGDDAKGPEGASVPSLGLSNKAVFSDADTSNAGDDNDGYFVPVNLHEPPTEETLMQNTLWPEVHKLYGHGYEVYCVDASADGALVASACKATTPEHAAVLIWETKTWQQIQKLTSHQLTITQLAFSPDSQKLLSVSRDRRWSLYQRDVGANSFTVAASSDKKYGVHTRIIWCCAWAPDSTVFSTGSRDGKVCVWSKGDTISESSLKEYSLLGKPLELTNSVTALAFAPLDGDLRLVAVGLDCGTVRIYQFDLTWSLLHELDHSMAHHLTVKRLFFRPRPPGEGETNTDMLLASCGTDHFVRICSLNIL